MALRAAEVEYELVRASSWEPELGLDKLRRVNPLLQIPTLVLDDGSVLTGSSTICDYLNETFAGGRLLPAVPQARFEVGFR